MNLNRWIGILTILTLLGALPLGAAAEQNTVPLTCKARLMDTKSLEITLTNETTQDTQITFPSSKRFEIVAYRAGNPEGVWQWSKGRMFTQALEFVNLKAGESMTYVLDLKGLPERVNALAVQPMAMENIAAPALLEYQSPAKTDLSQISYQGSISKHSQGWRQVVFVVRNTGKEATELTFAKGPMIEARAYAGTQLIGKWQIGAGGTKWSIAAGGQKTVTFAVKSTIKKSAQLEMRCLANELASKGMVLTLQVP